ncbi:MAG: AraC family transcriptional regulator [Eubacteriales bacterium]|nr:AraC family transcriptional regulator [Eubacteriales bacterium]
MYQAIVIDDEKWVIKSLIATISDQDYFEITGEFLDGVSGLSYIKEHQPDLAFVDVRLPGMSGLELLQEAQKAGCRTLFIIISGHAEFAYAQKAMLHNAIGYCLKPFSKSELTDAMQKAFHILEDRKEPAPPEPPAPEPIGNFVPKTRTVSNRTVQTMLDYITQHYCEDLSIQDLSDLCCINPNYASQLFKQETGCTFSSYLTDLRIQRAVHLLTTTDMAVFLIASHVGYRDYFYFAKVFKKITGSTPTAYRKEVLGKQVEEQEPDSGKEEPS